MPLFPDPQMLDSLSYQNPLGHLYHVESVLVCERPHTQALETNAPSFPVNYLHSVGSSIRPFPRTADARDYGMRGMVHPGWDAGPSKDQQLAAPQNAQSNGNTVQHHHCQKNKLDQLLVRSWESQCGLV